MVAAFDLAPDDAACAERREAVRAAIAEGADVAVDAGVTGTRARITPISKPIKQQNERANKGNIGLTQRRLVSELETNA